MRINIEKQILARENELRSQALSTHALVDQWERTLSLEKLALERRKVRLLSFLKKIPRVFFLKTLISKYEKLLSADRVSGIDRERKRVQEIPSIKTVLGEHKELCWHFFRSDVDVDTYTLRGLFIHEDCCVPYWEEKDREIGYLADPDQMTLESYTLVPVDHFSVCKQVKISQRLSPDYAEVIHRLQRLSFQIKMDVLRLAKERVDDLAVQYDVPKDFIDKVIFEAKTSKEDT